MERTMLALAAKMATPSATWSPVNPPVLDLARNAPPANAATAMASHMTMTDVHAHRYLRLMIKLLNAPGAV
jgi:hypothetical protein